jgi:hypothetical protein
MQKLFTPKYTNPRFAVTHLRARKYREKRKLEGLKM